MAPFMQSKPRCDSILAQAALVYTKGLQLRLLSQKHHRLGDLNNEPSFLIGFKANESKVKALADVWGEPSSWLTEVHLLLYSYKEGTNPIMRAPLSRPNYLPGAPPVNTTLLGLGFNIPIWGRHKHAVHNTKRNQVNGFLGLGVGNVECQGI